MTNITFQRLFIDRDAFVKQFRCRFLQPGTPSSNDAAQPPPPVAGPQASRAEPKSLGMVVGTGADLAVSLTVCMAIHHDHQAHQLNEPNYFLNELCRTHKLVG